MGLFDDLLACLSGTLEGVDWPRLRPWRVALWRTTPAEAASTKGRPEELSWSRNWLTWASARISALIERQGIICYGMMQGWRKVACETGAARECVQRSPPLRPHVRRTAVDGLLN